MNIKLPPKSTPTHRLSINELELRALTNLLDTVKSTKTNIPAELLSVRIKCKNIIEKILAGQKTPDYMPTGRIAGKNHVSLEMLGAAVVLDETLKPNEMKFSNSDSLYTMTGMYDTVPGSIKISNSVFTPRTHPNEPTEDEFAAAQKELDEAIEGKGAKRMSAEEWEEQRILYPFLPEIQPD